MRTTAFLVALCLVVSLSACQEGPRRISKDDPDRVVSMGMDHNDMVEVASSLIQGLLTNSFLDRPPYRDSKPPLMSVSRIHNNTNIPNLPSDMVLSRIREAILNSGKAQFSGYIDLGQTGDELVGEIRDLEDDPNIDKSTLAGRGTVEASTLSLRTEINYIGSANREARENTYEIHMWVTDLRSGRVMWEKTSDPIVKQKGR